MLSGNEKRILISLRSIKAYAEECIVILDAGLTLDTAAEGLGSRRVPRNSKPQSRAKLDFEQPMIAFIKKNATQLSGPKKFTLLLARLTRGNMKQEISLQQIEKQWNRMTGKSLLGVRFNRFYASQARQQDWVELKKKGIYLLRPAWREIFD